MRESLSRALYTRDRLIGLSPIKLLFTFVPTISHDFSMFIYFKRKILESFKDAFTILYEKTLEKQDTYTLSLFFNSSR